MKHGRFPRILIVDELAVTGHDLSELLYTLEDAIISAWLRQVSDYDKTELRKLRASLLAAIDCRTFKIDARGLLVERNLAEQLYSRDDKPFAHGMMGKPQLVDAAEWFPYIQTVCQFITFKEKVENTAFTPTFYLEESDYRQLWVSLLRKGNRWHITQVDGSRLEMAGTVDVIQQNLADGETSILAHMALYCHQRSDSSSVSVTPYVIFSHLPDFAIDDMFGRVQYYLNQQNNKSHLAQILQYPYRELDSVKLQLISTILSILLIDQCWRQAGFTQENIEHLIKSSDLKKISQAYGFIKNVFPELCQLLNGENVNKELFQSVLNIITGCGKELGISNCNDFCDEKEDDVPTIYIKKAKNYFTNAVNQKYHTQLLRRKRGIIYSTWSEFINEEDGLNRYLDMFPRQFDNVDRKIAVLLFLIHQGYVSQCIHNGESDICFLNAGEASFALEFLPMSKYLPALVSLERICNRNGLNALRWVTRFGQYLDENELGINLEEKFHSFAENIYSCGYRLQDWPFTEGIGETLQPEPRKYSKALRDFLL